MICSVIFCGKEPGHFVCLEGGYYAEICSGCLNRWSTLLKDSGILSKKNTLLNKRAAFIAAGTGLGISHASTILVNLDSNQSEIDSLDRRLFDAAQLFCKGKPEEASEILKSRP